MRLRSVCKLTRVPALFISELPYEQQQILASRIVRKICAKRPLKAATHDPLLLEQASATSAMFPGCAACL